MKKILYYSSYDISEPRGPSVNEFEFTAALAKRFGKAAWCVVPRPAVEVVHLSRLTAILYPPGSITNISSAVRVARRISQIVRAQKIDLIVVRMRSTWPLVPWLLEAVFRKRVAVKSCGQFWGGAQSQSLVQRVLNRANRRLVFSVLKGAVAIDAVTTQIREKVVQVTGNSRNVAHIDNSTDIDKFRPFKAAAPPFGLDLEESCPVVGYVGGSPSTRGARQLTEVAKLLTHEYPKLKVIVAGVDPALGNVIRLAKEYGVEDRCHFLGVIPYDQVPAFINLIDIGVSFDLPENIRKKGNSSQKLRQYIACGKPVITVGQSDHCVTAHDLGTAVEPTDLAGIAAAVCQWHKRLQRDPDVIRERLRAYAVEYFCADKALEKRLKFWSSQLINM